jgi:hypothetical protein
MEKWELLDGLEETKEGLERIVGIIDTDFLNRHVIEGVIKDITKVTDKVEHLHFHINANTEDFK